jgi:SM-20-related protein
MLIKNDLIAIPAFEAAADALAGQGYTISLDLFPPDLLLGLREILLAKLAEDELYRAGIGNGDKGARNAEIRRDKIKWLETQTLQPFERAYLDRLLELGAYFNRTLYTGINDLEFHFACFETGAFYKRHLDRFRSDNGRKISVITYLNQDWMEEDGGELVMYLPDGELKVLPEMGKTVLFRSDAVEHEVLTAKARRLSVTGWMK